MGGEDNLSVPLAGSSVSPSRKRLGELSDLKKQRGSLKSRLTHFKKYLDNFNNSSPSQLQIKEIKFRMQAAHDLFKTFNEVENQIELYSPESDVESNQEYVVCFESLYFSVLATAESMIEGEETGNSKCTGHLSRANVKLPDIKLPFFDGSFDHWLEYKNSYLTMIHKRSDLDEIQKFHYLRSSLSGSALQVISALEFTASNYDHAWDLLHNRFHNTRLLTHNHLKSLFSIPTLKQESHTHIRKLIDTVLRNLRALKTLDEPTDSWDTIIIYLIVTKLDFSTERDWENHKGSILTDSSKKLKLEDLLSFLKNKADMLDMINAGHNKLQNKPMNIITDNKHCQNKSNAPVHSYLSTSNSNSKSKSSNFNKRVSINYFCPLCNGNHALYMCPNFLNLSCRDRTKFVDEKRLCSNCLRSGHSLSDSDSQRSDCRFGPCRQCQNKHNTLLHINDASSVYSQQTAASHAHTGAGAGSSAALHSLSAINDSLGHADNHSMRSQVLQPVLLCTALVEIVGRDERVHTARALLDNGSQHCFISDKLRKRLNAPYIQSTIRISGVAQTVTQSNQLCEIVIRSKLSDFSKMVKCFVLQRITSSLPLTSIDTDLIRIPDNVQLADPTYHTPSEIDLLIGADLFWELLSDNRIHLENGPYLQNSKLGWLLSGPLYTRKLCDNDYVHCNFSQSIDEQLKRFWEIENVPQSCNVLTHDERLCEELFTQTTKRESGGRFSVRIPLKESPESLGDSYNLAKNRFLSLERKLERSPQYKRMYSDFMKDYESLGHMSRIEKVDQPNFFLPHHGVFREDSSTTKLRVVFNGSAATTSGKSLNDVQLPGPALQNDIFSILLRFRQYKYVACADVEKMFRQVLIQPDQRTLQLILWRETPIEPLGVFQLNTVTYGTASAPYLSMRCIRQLALDSDDNVIARTINEDFFVDDLITGNNDHQQLLLICEKITNVLQSGCFPLRKWTFNFDVTHSAPAHLFVGEHTQNKTLGIGWHNDSDELYYTTKIDEYSHVSKLTKRVMLSTISQIYDPLGLLSPAVILSKIILQKLWLSKLDWDDPVSPDIELLWRKFIETLSYLSVLKIPRHALSDNVQHIELHIFSDASQNAYGACAYIRSYNEDSEVTVRLLCAKSRVSPLKALSIPRLELSGALVGARLYKKIKDSIRLKFTKVYFWTDSTIVIGWMNMSPHLLKSFVQNRVTEINELTENSSWLHVASKENPADLLSRGLTLDSLIGCDLWWNGPSYIQHNHNDLFSNNLININNLPELKSQSFNLVSISPCDIIQFHRYSSFSKLKRVWAFVLRFSLNIRSSYYERIDSNNDVPIGPSMRQTGLLSVSELNASQRFIVRCAQMQSFTELYECLINKLPIKINAKEMSYISGLNVFLDDQGLIRVGGRLYNSTSFDYNKKHPILLSSKHYLSELLVRYEHLRLLHAGSQLVLSCMREDWWLLGARNLIRKIVHECVTCRRMRGKTLTPIMGNLPSQRLEPGFPFIRTGVDYAGPIMILNKKGRGARLVKGYICLFICFLTRAVHLELVTSLSANDYILALKRFISRRGKPTAIYSDNGKNFVGAAKELSAFLSSNKKQISEFAANDSIEFHFIPPYSPHFGGLWESGIRSCKHHLRRIVGNANLTFEEMSTVLTQIEAVLNSRPMSPLSTDPTDLNPLTPSHFLIGRPLTAVPGEDLTDKRASQLNRFLRVEHLRQHFWKRWSREYISELQQRTKWKSHKDDIALDSLVLIKEDNLPPLKWRLGRVIQIFPGSDGVSRVADIRTANGITRRAFSKICPLPMQPEDIQEPDASSLEAGASKAGGMSPLATTNAI